MTDNKVPIDPPAVNFSTILSSGSPAFPQVSLSLRMLIYLAVVSKISYNVLRRTLSEFSQKFFCIFKLVS